MKIKLEEGVGYVVIMNEFELHNLIASAREKILSELTQDIEEGDETLEDMSGCIDAVRIVPDDEALFPPELVHKWSNRMTRLFEELRDNDVEIHDDAEYTC